MKILNNNPFKTGAKCFGFFFHLHLCNISSRYSFHFVFCLSGKKKKESLLLQKSMCCKPTIPNVILWDHILGRRCLGAAEHGQFSGAAAVSQLLLQEPSTETSVTANTPKAQHVITSSPQNRSSVSSRPSSSPLCQCGSSVIRQGGHRCSTVAATFRKKSKITALVARPLFRSTVVFIRCVRALSLSLLTKFLL